MIAGCGQQHPAANQEAVLFLYLVVGVLHGRIGEARPQRRHGTDEPA